MQVRTKLHEQVLGNLKKLSFTSSGKQPKGSGKNGRQKNRANFGQGKKDDTNFHFSNAGRLVAGRQLVYLIDDELGKDRVSFYGYRFQQVMFKIIFVSNNISNMSETSTNQKTSQNLDWLVFRRKWTILK